MTRSVARAMLLCSALLLGVEVPPAPHALAAPACSDLALVLAVDGSASVSAGEFALQRQGIATAFRDPEVLEAVRRAGRLMVAAVFWGSEGLPKQQTQWVTVEDAEGAERFARTIEAMPRQVTGDTGLGAGLTAALVKLTAPDVCATRRIINLSGDGEETRVVRGKRRHTSPPQVRDLAETLQVEINALAITTEEPDLAQYYAANVIAGPAAFVMEVHDYASFATALRRKLIREISPRDVAGLVPR